jgi:hypothetical protein
MLCVKVNCIVFIRVTDKDHDSPIINCVMKAKKVRAGSNIHFLTLVELPMCSADECVADHRPLQDFAEISFSSLLCFYK